MAFSQKCHLVFLWSAYCPRSIAQSCLTLCDPMNWTHQAPCPWDSPGKNTGMGCHALLQGNLPSPGSNPHLLCLLHWQSGSLPLGHIVICHFTKTPSNYHTMALISHTSKVMLKILQARLQQYVNREFPGVQAGFRKGRGTGDQIANICWIIENAKEFQKNIYFCFIDYTKAFDCVDHNKLWKILKEMGIPGLVPNWERSTSRLYIITLFI